MTPRIRPKERRRFALFASLLFINALILESNEVVATSGFVSSLGAQNILWVWAIDMFIVILASGAYSLVVDRTQRPRLALFLFAGFGVVYVLLYLLLRLQAPEWLSYPLLTLINDQQWLIFPMLIWALGNDAFSTAEAKRLFPLLGIAAFAGGITGNGLTAVAARWITPQNQGSIDLLLVNAGLLGAMMGVLGLSLRGMDIHTRQCRQEETILDTLREGMAFVRDVPSYRYLTIAMVLLGIGFNVIEYQLIVGAASAYTEAPGLEAFYATIRAARTVLMLIVQGAVSGWLMKQLGFKGIFAMMPVALLSGLLLAFVWPTLIGVIIGEYLARVTLSGIDEPARRAFLNLVPDERRGRVSAFIEGYLYPLGSLVSCGLIGGTLVVANNTALSAGAGRAITFGLAIAAAAAALWAIARFRSEYDKSMLNWRLKRRKRKSVLDGLDF